MKKLKNLRVKWQNWKTKPTSFTERKKVGMTLRHLMLRVTNAYVQWSLYTRCSELPLERFIRCVCDGDLVALQKYRFTEKRTLERVWAKLIEEYAKLSGDAGYERNFILSKEITRENGKLVLIKLCLNVLIVKYSRKCIDRLIMFGYDYPFDRNDPTGFRRDLERVSKNARMISIEIETKQKQYDKLTAGVGKRPSHDSFTKILTTLSRHMGYRIDSKLVTVSEYIAMQKQYGKEVKASLENSKVSQYKKSN